MRRLLLLALPASLGGCESCDFSFGLIPVQVQVHLPVDRAVAVVVCPEKQDCIPMARTTSTGDTGPSTPLAGPGVFEALVSHNGYITCRIPEMEIVVEADGCAAEYLVVERAKLDGPTRFTVSPSCP